MIIFVEMSMSYIQRALNVNCSSARLVILHCIFVMSTVLSCCGSQEDESVAQAWGGTWIDKRKRKKGKKKASTHNIIRILVSSLISDEGI